MADFCRACTAEVFGPEYADRNDLATGGTIDWLCEGCGPGTFGPDGTRMTTHPTSPSAQCRGEGRGTNSEGNER